MRPSGAVLLAVMRGRSSEGVDFLDDCARAVVVVGIPFPPLYETTVRLKRSFNQDHEAVLGSGDDWYTAEAFRAVNQALGERKLLSQFQRIGCKLFFLIHISSRSIRVPTSFDSCWWQFIM